MDAMWELAKVMTCGMCDLSFKVERVGEHIERVHLGGGGDLWQCGECPFRGIDLDQIGSHCLLLHHDASRVTRDLTALPILAAIQRTLRQSPPPAPLPQSNRKETTLIYEEEAEEAPIKIRKGEAFSSGPETDHCFMSEAESDSECADLKSTLSEISDSPIGDGANQMECSQCHKLVPVWKVDHPKTLSYLDTYKLRLHIQRKHIWKQSIYKCESCKYQANTKEDMRAHMGRKHKNSKARILLADASVREKVLEILLVCFPAVAPKFRQEGKSQRFISSF